MDVNEGADKIKRRRYSSARIQPTRIKKVMQSDEDIGRMVQSVPVAMGRMMEHFAEKFLEASAEMVANSAAKTLSPGHMKAATESMPCFHFLRPIFASVPTPSSSHGGRKRLVIKDDEPCSTSNDLTIVNSTKRKRKVAEDIEKCKKHVKAASKLKTTVSKSVSFSDDTNGMDDVKTSDLKHHNGNNECKPSLGVDESAK